MMDLNKEIIWWIKDQDERISTEAVTQLVDKDIDIPESDVSFFLSC